MCHSWGTDPNNNSRGVYEVSPSKCLFSRRYAKNVIEIERFDRFAVVLLRARSFWKIVYCPTMSRLARIMKILFKSCPFALSRFLLFRSELPITKILSFNSAFFRRRGERAMGKTRDASTRLRRYAGNVA